MGLLKAKEKMMIRFFVCLLILLSAFSLCNESFAQCPPMDQGCTETLAQRESSGNYQSVNEFGFLGAYQFGEAAMQDVGFYNGDGTNSACLASQGGCDWAGSFTGFMGVNSVDDYLHNEAAQQYAVARLAELNMERHYSDVSPYIGMTLADGTTVTCEGLMMAMHLKGSGAVQTYLESNGTTNPTDAYGTGVSEYMQLGESCSNGVYPAPTTEYESCDQDILSVGAQLSESRMQVEKQQIDEAISKPQNVGEMTCMDQFGEMFNQEIGRIFGNTDGDSISGGGLEIFDFDGIFTQTQQAINTQINNAISNGLLGGRGLNVGGAISDALSGVFGTSVSGSNVNFTCEAMNLLWEIMQCEDIFDFQIPSLNDLLGDFSLSSMLEDIMPDSCAGQVLTQAALEKAGTVFSSFDSTLAEAINPTQIESTLNSY